MTLIKRTVATSLSRTYKALGLNGGHDTIRVEGNEKILMADFSICVTKKVAERFETWFFPVINVP